ncbi:hypothetical protein [Thiocapsa sp.]
MKNRQLDATLQSSGLGMAAFRDLASTMSVRFIPVPADVVAAIGSPPIGPASSPPTPKTSVARDTRSAVSRMPRGALRQVPRWPELRARPVSAAHSAGKGIKRPEHARGKHDRPQPRGAFQVHPRRFQQLTKV